VRFILGTPLVADIFHAARWDYIYSFKPGRGEVQLRRFAVFFTDNKLARVAGDVVGSEPGEAEAATTAAAGARSRVIEIAPDGEKKKEEAKEGEQKPENEAKSDGAAQPAEKK
jgi:outer membrane protein assembly factor BamE